MTQLIVKDNEPFELESHVQVHCCNKVFCLHSSLGLFFAHDINSPSCHDPFQSFYSNKVASQQHCVGKMQPPCSFQASPCAQQGPDAEGFVQNHRVVPQRNRPELKFIF